MWEGCGMWDVGCGMWKHRDQVDGETCEVDEQVDEDEIAEHVVDDELSAELVPGCRREAWG